MLSDRYFRIFGFQLRFAHFLMGTPFKWCASERRLYVTKLSHVKYATIISTLVFYGIFLLVQLIRYNRMGLNTDFYYYFTYALWICAILDTIIAYPVLRRPRMAAAFMTEFYRFLDEIQSDFMPTFDPNRSCKNYIFDFLVMKATIVCPFLGVVISCHYLFFPSWPCYITSLVPPEYLNWMVILSGGILYFYGLQIIWAVLLINVVCYGTYGWYNWQVVHEYYCFSDDVRGPPGYRAKRVWSRQKASQAFRSYEEFPLRYRQFQILHLNFQEVFSSMIIPMQATITNLGLFCNVSLIKYKHLLNLTNTAILLIWSVGATVAMLIALSFAGTMYLKNVRALNTVKNKQWGSKIKNMEMRKFVRSCKPISYGYGRMYVIRMVSVFKFIRHLTRGTFRALLTLK